MLELEKSVLRTDRQAVPTDGLDLTFLVASRAPTPQIVQGGSFHLLFIPILIQISECRSEGAR